MFIPSMAVDKSIDETCFMDTTKKSIKIKSGEETLKKEIENEN